jgi:hypothetical protein
MAGSMDWHSSLCWLLPQPLHVLLPEESAACTWLLAHPSYLHLGRPPDAPTLPATTSPSPSTGTPA